jgi:hypothetical protein
VSLEQLPRQVSWDDVQAAVPVVRAAREKARAAGAAAGAAARAAAWAAARDAARDAARAAARDKLQPTVDALQDNAIELYRRMIHPEKQPEVFGPQS